MRKNYEYRVKYRISTYHYSNYDHSHSYDPLGRRVYYVVPISDTVQRFITAMSGSVLVVLLAPIAVEGDNGARLALGTTLLVRHILQYAFFT